MSGTLNCRSVRRHRQQSGLVPRPKSTGNKPSHSKTPMYRQQPDGILRYPPSLPSLTKGNSRVRQSSHFPRDWFWSPSHALRWAWIYLVGTSQPFTLAQASSPPERWHYMSQSLVLVDGDQSARASAPGRHSVHTAPGPYSISCRWQADRCPGRSKLS